MEDIYTILILISFICLVVGVIKPTFFSRVLKSWATRGRIGLVFGISTFILFVLFGITSDKNEVARQAEAARLAAQIIESKKPEANQEEAIAERNSENLLPANTDVQQATLVPEEEKKAEETFEVVRAVDGDTIVLNINGKAETLRLIGIDTPETVDPRKPVQCFGKEASDKAKATLNGKIVKIEADPSQGERDKYQRLLRYVFLEDGTSYNKMMIEEGYAHEYTYNLPYKYQAEYKEAETSARDNKRGLWGDVCNGNTSQSAQNTSTPSAAAVTAVTEVEPERTPSSSLSYGCNCKKTCAQMSSCDEAQYQLKSCGCSARDADKDGTACDSQCQ